jgi:hypothetical protein
VCRGSVMPLACRVGCRLRSPTAACHCIALQHTTAAPAAPHSGCSPTSRKHTTTVRRLSKRVMVRRGRSARSALSALMPPVPPPPSPMGMN